MSFERPPCPPHGEEVRPLDVALDERYVSRSGRNSSIVTTSQTSWVVRLKPNFSRPSSLASVSSLPIVTRPALMAPVSGFTGIVKVAFPVFSPHPFWASLAPENPSTCEMSRNVLAVNGIGSKQ